MSTLVKLSVVPRKENESLWLLSAGEYIVGIRETLIFRYNVHNDDCTLVMELPDSLMDNERLLKPIFFIDKNAKQLFILCQGTTMMVIDLKNGSVIHQALAMDERCGQTMVRVGDIFHLVGLSGGITDGHRLGPFVHDILYRTHRKWVLNKDINDFGGFHDWITNKGFQFDDVEAMSLIHVPSQNILLLFCRAGSEMEYKTFGVWRYHITKGQWTRVDGIEFDFESEVVLTADEKYVVIIGGNELYIDDDGCNQEVENQDDIFVLDIQNKAEYKLWGTSIRVPQPEGSNWRNTINGATSSKESADYISLTSGWVRKLFASELFVGKVFPPLVILEMIEEYRKHEETIHWVTTNKTWSWVTTNQKIEENHYAMPLKQILSSMNETAHQIEVEGTNYWTDVCKRCNEDDCICNGYH